MALIAEIPTVLIVRKDMPVNNLKEFVAYAKKNQDKMSYGSAGTGSATHLACIVLDAAMGTHITHVPYRGTGPPWATCRPDASTISATSSPRPRPRSTAAP